MSIPSAFVIEVCRQLSEMVHRKYSTTVRLTLMVVEKGREEVLVETELHLSEGRRVGRARTDIYSKQTVIDSESAQGVESV